MQASNTLILKDDQNTDIANAVTNASGFYEFVGFCSGTYKVEVNPATLPSGLIPTAGLVGADDSTDSNGSPAVVVLSGDYNSDITHIPHTKLAAS